MSKEQTLGLVRHILTYAGGWVASQGYLSQEEAIQLGGAIVTLVGVVWSVWDKVKVQKMLSSYQLTIMQLEERTQDDS